MDKLIAMSDISKLNKDEINSKIVECRKGLFDQRMTQSTQKIEKPHLGGVYRKNIARLQTALSRLNKESK